MNENRPMVYVIDDDDSLRFSVRQCLECLDFTVRDFTRAEDVLEHTTTFFEGVILSDVRMPDMDGLCLLRHVREIDSDLPVILITAHGDVATAVEAMQRGAYDFIEKPFDEHVLVDVLRRALEKRRLVLDLRRAHNDLAAADGLDLRFIGTQSPMREIKRRIMDIAPIGASVLLWGETGTGKEVVARCIHDYSPRKGKPFVVMDCASIPVSIAESELFGYVKGAFTGADRNHVGKLESAEGGTLFLDEVNSLPSEVQGKLLRALQEKSVTPVGAHLPKPVDFRVISSTNEDLRAAIRQRQFREDLFYRLATIELNLPPLRDHKADIPLLFGLFLDHAAATYGREVPRPDNADMTLLMAYGWPGNVRELRNMAERYLLSGSASLKALVDVTAMRFLPNSAKPPTLTDHVGLLERQLIMDAVRRYKGDMRAVMEDLGVPRRTLNEKMTRYGISRVSILENEVQQNQSKLN